MNKIKCIIVNITLVIITSCSTAPSAQGTTSQSQEQQQNGVVTEQSTEEAIHEKTQENSPFSSGHPYSDERVAEALSAIHPRLTDVYIGDDGLFQIVAPDSEYFTDSWYRGYAGMLHKRISMVKLLVGMK